MGVTVTHDRKKNPSLRERGEFVLVWLLVRGLGLLPRTLAHAIGKLIGALALLLLKRLRRTGLRNLELAFPDWPARKREQVLRQAYRNLGRLLAEFCLMSHYTAEQASHFISYEGLENYLAARDGGRGVLVLTGHLGAWELSSFYHSLVGYRMGLVIRRLDNPLVDRFVNSIRTLHGNRVIHKDDFARGIISAMRAGDTVGILMDTNMTPPQGIFVPFFGIEACSASGLAKVALKTGAAVLPGFLLWDDNKQNYVLRFGPRMVLTNTGDTERDVRDNTAAFTAQLEQSIRANPEQWLWMHRRWKTRPAGEEGLY